MIRFKIKIIILLIVVAGFSSCSDFLDIRPESDLDPEYVFGDVNNAKLAVIGVYTKLISLESSCFFSFAYPADDTMGNYNPNVDDRTYSLMRYDYKPINSSIINPFINLYDGIDRANICIDEIPKMALYTEGTEDEKFELKRLFGEALTLRALYYFELIKNWGDVPLTLTPSYTQTDLFLPKTSRDSIYNHILNDLEYATTELLPWRSEVERDERITKGAAKALRARIAMFAGGYSLRKNRQMERPDNYLDYYEIARDECYEMMQEREEHTLNPSYESLFKSNCEFKKDPYAEFVFEIGFKAGETGTFGFYDGPSVTFPNGRSLSSQMAFVVPSYFYAFDSLDVRRDVTITLGNVNFNTNIRRGRRLDELVNGKFRIDWIDPTPPYDNPIYTGVNFPIIRFSDVLLMFAEAENELNNGATPQAIAAYEEVRIRGFGGDATLIGATPTSKIAFFDAIVKERLFEFGNEAIRKFDLIRWNKLGSTIQETKEELQKMSERQFPYDQYPSYVYYKSNSWDLIWFNSFYKPHVNPPSGYTLVAWLALTLTKLKTNYAPFFEAGRTELLPIPQSVIDSNPNLTQDFGY